MGKKVLPVDNGASPYLRSYAHCAKGRVSLSFSLHSYVSISCATLCALGCVCSLKV